MRLCDCGECDECLHVSRGRAFKDLDAARTEVAALRAALERIGNEDDFRYSDGDAMGEASFARTVLAHLRGELCDDAPFGCPTCAAAPARAPGTGMEVAHDDA